MTKNEIIETIRIRRERNQRIASIQEFIDDTYKQMETSPKEGIAGTIVKSHSVMKGWIEQAEEQIEQLRGW
jgi:hypothetical protein